MPQTTKKYFDELNIFRAVIIIWVTIGHSTDYIAAYPFSGFLKNYAYTFHMSAFFLLSGILFAGKLQRITGAKEAAGVVADRFKRLMVPYLFFSAVSYLLKFFLEKYAFNELSSNPLLDILTGSNNPNGGIWFLYALFFMSVIAVALYKVPPLFLLIAGMAIKAVNWFVAIPSFGFEPLSSFYTHSVYFFFGIFIMKYYADISAYLVALFQKKKGLCCFFSLILAMGSFLIYYLVKGKLHLLFCSYFLLCVAHIFVWYTVSLAINSIKPIRTPIAIIGNYGMDIYMIGYYVMTAVRVVCGTILGMPFLIFTFLMFALGLLLPIPISKYIVRKIPILRMLMLGDFSKSKGKEK